MFTLEITVPKQHVPEKFDRFIASSRIKVKETGEYVKLTRSAVPKILALKCVVVNGLPLKDKSTKVKPNDFIVIELANIDSFKVDQQSQLKSEEQQQQLKQKQSQVPKQNATTTAAGTTTTTGTKVEKPWWENKKDKFDDQEGLRPHAKRPANKKPSVPGNNVVLPPVNNSGNFKLVATDIKLNIVYEDKDLAIINKPAGMLVHPIAMTLGSNALMFDKEEQTHTLVNALIHRYGGIDNLSSIGGIERPGIVHRLDKDTAGMIIIARNNESHQKLQTLFEKHTSTMITHTTIDEYDENSASINNNAISNMLVGKKIPLTIQKKYHCVVLGKPKEPHGFINKKISRHPGDKNKMVIDERNGKHALTEYKVLKTWENVDAQVYDNQRNKNLSKSTSSSTSTNTINNTLSEYDNVMNQLSKKKKKNTKKQTTTKQVNSKMSFLAVDESDDEEDKEVEEEKVVEEVQVKPAPVVVSPPHESDEESEEEDSDDEDEDESEDEEENYDEIIERLQQKTKKISCNTFSLLEVTLHTGRSHQIRVHMASENIPIVGDPIYSSKSKQFLVSHLLLGSMFLKFVHPILNEIKEFTIPYPSHFKNFIASIEGKEIETSDEEDDEDSDDEEDSEDEDIIPKLVQATKFVKSTKPTTTANTNTNNKTKKKNTNYINSLGNNSNIEADLLSDFLKNKK